MQFPGAERLNSILLCLGGEGLEPTKLKGSSQLIFHSKAIQLRVNAMRYIFQSDRRRVSVWPEGLWLPRLSVWIQCCRWESTDLLVKPSLKASHETQQECSPAATPISAAATADAARSGGGRGGGGPLVRTMQSLSSAACLWYLSLDLRPYTPEWACLLQLSSGYCLRCPGGP